MRQINSFLGRYYQDRHLRPLPRHQYQHHRTNIKRNAGCWRNPKSRERKRHGIYCQIKDPVIIYRPHFRFICLIWYQNEADKFIFGQIIEKINCEDRAVLFTRIVRDLLGLKCISPRPFFARYRLLLYQLSLHYITWQEYSHTLSTMSWRLL